MFNQRGLIIVYAAFAIAILALLSLFLWQRNTVVKQKAEINALMILNAGYKADLEAAAANMKAIKELTAAQQKVTTDTDVLMAAVQNIKTKITLEESDAKTICAITEYFNNAGILRSADSSAKAGGQVLPAAAAAGSCGANWTAEQIIENYLKVIRYAIGWEKTGACYETGN